MNLTSSSQLISKAFGTVRNVAPFKLAGMTKGEAYSFLVHNNVREAETAELICRLHSPDFRLGEIDDSRVCRQPDTAFREFVPRGVWQDRY